MQDFNLNPEGDEKRFKHWGDMFGPFSGCQQTSRTFKCFIEERYR